ncbi:MAG: thiolase family protein [Dehalococcoidia bacterium]|nr:thiolase family protein [Dehalococcoidia bacterium]
MTLRGVAAIVGISEIPTRRTIPGRSTLGLMAEAVKMALDDAHLRKEDVDGLVGEMFPGGPAEYMGIKPRFCQGVQLAGATGAACIEIAAAAINAGLAQTIVVTLTQAREAAGYMPLETGGPGASTGSEWESWLGPAAGANNGYGLLYRRHMHEFGTTERQLARIAANQRFNALQNPNSAFQGQPITLEDVMNSRYINEPLKMLESVMPAAGGGAVIVTTAERAKAMPNRPVYVLGAAVGVSHGSHPWQLERTTTSAVSMTAPDALKMAGYRAKDMQFAQFYD